MASAEYLVYRTFNDVALADELTTLLSRTDISFETEEGTTTIVPISNNKEAEKIFAVKLKAEDFKKADEHLSSFYETQLGEVDDSHPLFQFTADELREVVARADEWTPLDVLLAQKLLKEKGKEISPSQLEDLKRKRLTELKQPEPTPVYWIFVGYLTALLGGWISIFIGWYITNQKKTLPGGERVYVFSDDDRRQGKTIFYLGLFFFTFTIIIITVLKAKLFAAS